MRREQRIREGHRMLDQMCRCDQGYDLLAWHNEVCETRAGGYSWGKRRGIPTRIQNSIDDPGWKKPWQRSNELMPNGWQDANPKPHNNHSTKAAVWCVSCNAHLWRPPGDVGRYVAMRRPLIITGIVVVFIVAAAILSSHRGGLAHFSPHTLEYRTRSERTFFATGIPFYRSNHEQVDNPLVAMLINNGFVSPQPDNNGQWEVIFHWNDSWRDGYGPLYDIFHRHRDEIIEWSHNNRKCAEIYWSEGFRLLRSGNSIDVTAGRAILTYCWRINDPEEMWKAIQRIKTEVAT